MTYNLIDSALIREQLDAVSRRLKAIEETVESLAVAIGPMTTINEIMLTKVCQDLTNMRDEILSELIAYLRDEV